MKTNLVENTDGVDLRIISLLQEDSRLSFKKIANRLGISVGMAFNRVKNLEKKGVLKGYTVILDSVKLGYNLTAIIQIQAEGGHLSEVEREISKSANVIAVYDTAGSFDAALVSKFKDGVDLTAFIDHLRAMPYVKRATTIVAFNTIKEDCVKLPIR